MGLQIKDGTGQGNLVKVDVNNRLSTKAISLPEPSLRAQEGEFFIYFSGIIPIDGTLQKVFYKNLNGIYNFHIVGITISWNGGSTNHNRTLKYFVSIGDEDPTTNIVQASFLNTNLGSIATIPGTAFKWDEVGSGMTGGSAGTEAAAIIVDKGFTQFSFDAEFIITPGNSYSISFQGEEAGEASFSLNGYIDQGSS